MLATKLGTRKFQPEAKINKLPRTIYNPLVTICSIVGSTYTPPMQTVMLYSLFSGHLRTSRKGLHRDAQRKVLTDIQPKDLTDIQPTYKSRTNMRKRPILYARVWLTKIWFEAAEVWLRKYGDAAA